MEKLLREKLQGGQFRNVSPGRSRTMAAIRAKDNLTTERRLRMALVRTGIAGWKLHPEDIPGRPDIYFPQARLAIFADGCFWHGCPKCGHVPSRNSEFWRAKIERNRLRDTNQTEELQRQHIQVLRFWEHDLQGNLLGCIEAVMGTLQHGN